MRNTTRLFLFLILGLLCSYVLVFLIPEPLLFNLADSSQREQNEIILWQLRLPRVLLAFLVGAALAMGGAVFQALFRNPLASPYTLGISSGAALGATLYISFAESLVGGFSLALSSSAMIGAILSALLVIFTIARGRLSSDASILLGVVLNLFFSSLIMLVQYLSDQTKLLQITRWLMGSISIVGWHEISALAGVLIIVLPCIYILGMRLDLVSFGDEAAIAHGISIKNTYLVFIALLSLVIATVVSIVGPIGFIGIVVPHYLRLWGLHQNQKLIIGSCLLGGLFLAICDAVARTIVFPFEIPVGVVTALLGSPLFFHILLRKRAI